MNNKIDEIKQIISLAYENHKKNNLELAESLYNKILKIDQNHFDTIFLLGTLFLQKKNFNEAVNLFNKALKIRPNHPNTNHNLGYAFIEIGEHKKAKQILEKVIEMQPNHADAHYNLANIHKHFGDFLEAEKSYKRNIQIQPNNPASYNNLGNILKELGKHKEAINLYNKAIKIQYNHANAYHNLGNTYKQLGDLQNAETAFVKALEYRPTNLETLSVLVELKKEIISTNLLNKVRETMKIKNISKNNIAYGNFLFAKYEFQRRNFEKEFDYLLEGHLNYFDFRGKNFDQGIKYWLDEIPKTEELTNFTHSNSNSKSLNDEIKPIFIVGVPRCGSTLIEKVIASGSKKMPIGEETAVISYCVGKRITEKKSIKSDFKNFKEEVLEKYKQKRLLSKNSDYIFTDKSLDNFFFIGLIRAIFPNAKIINCMRNPLASIMSILKNNLGDVAWAHNPKHIFQYFDIYYKKIEIFKKKYPDFIYNLQLEDFVNSPEIESKKLMKFCNLPWSEKCLEFYKRKDLTSRTASNIQIRKAIYKDSMDRHQPYKNLLKKYGNKYLWFNN